MRSLAVLSHIDERDGRLLVDAGRADWRLDKPGKDVDQLIRGGTLEVHAKLITVGASRHQVQPGDFCDDRQKRARADSLCLELERERGAVFRAELHSLLCHESLSQYAL